MRFLYKVYEAAAKHRKVLGVLLLLFILGFGVNVVMRGGVGKPYRTDVTVFLRAAQAVEMGQDIYDAKTERQWNYVYLPLFAILLKPVAYMPLWAAVAAWYLLTMVMLAATVYLTARLGNPKGTGLLWQPALLALVFSLPAMLNTISRGQLGVLSLFFAVLCFFLYKIERKFLAGLLLAFAIVLKISPLFFLLGFFVLERQWRFLAGAALGFLLFIWVIPAAVVGWDTNNVYLHTWLEAMRLATSKFAPQSQLWGQLLDPYAEDNQSIYAVLMRVAGPARDQLVPGADDAIRLSARLCGGALLTVLSGTILLRLIRKSKCGDFLEYALLIMVMLYASPVSEDHHYAVIYLPFAAAFYLLGAKNLERSHGQWVSFAMGVGVVSLIFGMIFDSLNHWGAMVWGSLVLWLVLLFVHFQRILKLKSACSGLGEGEPL